MMNLNDNDFIEIKSKLFCYGSSFKIRKESIVVGEELMQTFPTE